MSYYLHCPVPHLGKPSPVNLKLGKYNADMYLTDLSLLRRYGGLLSLTTPLLDCLFHVIRL
jgi:hypothetical protein